MLFDLNNFRFLVEKSIFSFFRFWRCDIRKFRPLAKNRPQLVPNCSEPPKIELFGCPKVPSPTSGPMSHISQQLSIFVEISIFSFFGPSTKFEKATLGIFGLRPKSALAPPILPRIIPNRIFWKAQGVCSHFRHFFRPKTLLWSFYISQRLAISNFVVDPPPKPGQKLGQNFKNARNPSKMIFFNKFWIFPVTRLVSAPNGKNRIFVRFLRLSVELFEVLGFTSQNAPRAEEARGGYPRGL